MINVNRLRVFHAVAHLCSFTRAAEELCLTQPGISKHIKELEGYYGTRLFHRLGKTVALTQAGEILYQTTADMFHRVEEVKTKIDDLCGLASGSLSVGANIPIGYYFLPDPLVKFKKQYPGIKISVSISSNGQIVERVLSNEIELGLVGHYQPDNKLEVSTFFKDCLLLVAARNHRWVKRRSAVQLEELVEEPFCISSTASGTWRFLSNWFGQQGLIVNNQIELGTTEAVKHAVANGLGISILPRHVVLREVDGGSIKEIAFAGNIWREFYLVQHKERYLSNAARAFLNLFMPQETARFSPSFS